MAIRENPIRSEATPSDWCCLRLATNKVIDFVLILKTGFSPMRKHLVASLFIIAAVLCMAGERPVKVDPKTGTERGKTPIKGINKGKINTGTNNERTKAQTGAEPKPVYGQVHYWDCGGGVTGPVYDGACPSAKSSGCTCINGWR